jgi:hypothetical protein
VNIVLCIIFIPLTLLVTLNIKATPILNTSAIINSRLWENKEWREYVLSSGFPLDARTTFLNYTENNLGSPPDAAVSNLESYKNWYEKSGKNLLIRFMLAKLDYTFFSPFFMYCYSENKNLQNTAIFGYSQGMLNYQNIKSAHVINLLNINIFWPHSRILKYSNLSLLLILISINQFIFFRAKENKTIALLRYTTIVLVSSLFWSYLSWWFGSTPNEIPRHQFPVSVVIHLLGILNAVYLIEKITCKIRLRG